MNFITLRNFAALQLCVFLSFGCAHVKTTEKDSAASGTPRSIEQVLTQNIEVKDGKAKADVNGQDVQATGEITIRGVKLKNTKFDIPITINSRVENWVDYFTGKGRPHFEKYLARSEFFIPYIQPLLKQNGMPEDLVYLAMIESGFNNWARSRAKAVGPWQFISATGRRYGLMVNWWVDERRDVRKSTLAAVEYLRDLYNLFGSWELAAASYNAGEAKVARAIQRYGVKDFWVISKQRFLRPETRDYVPKIIAAALLAKNREQFGFPKAHSLHPGADEAISGDGELVKVIKTDKPLQDDGKNKPVPTPEISDSEAEAVLTANTESTSLDAADDDDFADDEDEDLPPGKNIADTGKQPSAAPTDSPIVQARPVPTPHMTRSGEVGGEELVEFEVQTPADLLKVARAAGLSYQTVKALNPELLRWCTPPRTGTYRLKLPSSTKDKFLTTYNHEAFPRRVQFLAYKVRRGETITNIARHFGIKVDPISELNGISAKTPLRSGARVILPIPNDRSRSLASLDVRDPPETRRRSSRRKHRRRSRYSKISHRNRESARSGRRLDSES